MNDISPETRAAIDRLAAHTWKRDGIDRVAVEASFADHMTALGLPMLPLHWFVTSQDAYGYIRSAAWSAARSAARSAAESAAWSAARSAARSAAEINAASCFHHPTQVRLAAMWSPLASAFQHGLWLFWIAPTEIICVEQPSLWIEDDRLHRSDGPAVEWPAGERYYFWRGTQVPQEWIMDKSSMDAATALTWPNIEQRRAACEIIGWKTVIAALSPRVINKHKNPQIGELIEVDLPDSGRERFLRVQCGTGRDFVLPVPRSCRTAMAAQAWTWGLSAKEFKEPEVRT